MLETMSRMLLALNCPKKGGVTTYAQLLQPAFAAAAVDINPPPHKHDLFNLYINGVYSLKLTNGGAKPQ